MIALLVLLATAQPRLGVVDTTPAGAPELAAALAVSAGKLGKFDVQPNDVVDAAVVEARRVGAACGFDDGPECWARLGLLSELDRIVVLRKDGDRLDLLLVDVPARTAARSSTTVSGEPKEAADQALAALLSGQAAPKPAPKPHGALWNTGVYTAAFGAVVVIGCGGGALGVSSQLASRLVQARDEGVPLDDDYRALDVSFVALSVCAGVATVAGVAGAVITGVAE